MKMILKTVHFRRLFSFAMVLWIVAVIGGVVFPYIRGGEIYDYQDTVDGGHLPDADVIVCLAGGRGRIAAAGDFWYRYWEAHSHDPKMPLPKLYISGMGPKADINVLRKQLRAGVRDVVHPEYVMIENESFNTEANARWLSRHLTETGWKKVILVTSPYHMKRALYIFQEVLSASGQSVQLDTLSAFQEPFEPGEWRSSIHGIHVTLLEYMKWVYYRYLWQPGRD